MSVRNLSASVRQRLLNRARAEGRPFNELLQYYAMERFLYRLSRSRFAGRFVLKGALLLRVWEAPVGRPTLDIDLLGRMDNEVDAVAEVMREVLQVPVEPDGVVFDVGSLEAGRIAEQAEYHGTRVKFRGQLDSALVRMQVDIGFGDPVHPAAREEAFPPLLDAPAPVLWCYSRESVVAEKLEAMVRHGAFNSRMKDFYDVWLLARTFAFDGPTLVEAVRRTFASRETAVSLPLVAFGEGFSVSKGVQWRAFHTRAAIEHVPDAFEEVVDSIRGFAEPVLASVQEGSAFDARWDPLGPWVPIDPAT